METRFVFDFPSWTEPSGQDSHLVVKDHTTDGLTYGCIFDYYAGDLLCLSSFDGIVIESTTEKITKLQISKIRTIRDRFLYLRPILVVKTGAQSDFLVHHNQDAIVDDLDSVRRCNSLVRHINQRAREIKLVQFPRYDDAVLFSLLTYLYTRSLEQIRPQVDPSTRVGFRYPILTDYDTLSAARVSHLILLDQAENAGYFTGHFHDVSYQCNRCNAGFLQFREVCPSCHSAHITSQEMVHHFRCAHVAPISEFTSKDGRIDGLHCTKCDHQLKHIGVDYDKPSELHQCRACDHEFQYFSVRAKCAYCGQDQQVEHLAKKEFKSYLITQKAIAALKEGRITDVLQDDPSEIEGAIDWNVFLKNLEFEITQNEYHFVSMVQIELVEFSSLQRKLGLVNTKKLLAEIVQVVRASQGTPDYCSVRPPRIYFTLHGVNAKEAQEIVQRTIFLLQHLLTDNLQLKQVGIKYDVLDADQIQSLMLEEIGE